MHHNSCAQGIIPNKCIYDYLLFDCLAVWKSDRTKNKQANIKKDKQQQKNKKCLHIGHGHVHFWAWMNALDENFFVDEKVDHYRGRMVLGF